MIREAQAKDDAAVGELLVRAFVDSYARKLPTVVVSEQRQADLRAVAAKRAVAQVWVAERDGHVVGTVAVWSPDAPGSEAFVPGAFDLRHLAVAASDRGSGLSSRLMDTAEGYARGRGGKVMCLHVRRGAVGVSNLYLKRGYRRAPEGDRNLLPEVFLDAYRLEL